MKVLVAPDSFKGSNSSLAVGERIKRGVLKVFPSWSVHCIPIADGGEGTVEAIIAVRGGDIRTVKVTGPLGDPVEAKMGFSGDTAVIEMAEASGLPLVPEEKRDPRITTTYGTGELIKAALDAGCKKIVMGIGGSATNDGGAGVAQALGILLSDSSGTPLPPGGGALANLAQIDFSQCDPRLKDVEITVACDVTNPLLGEKGASAIYGPQKGATEETVKELDQALTNMADIAEKQLNCEYRMTPGAGAAGGLGFGLIAFCGAKLQSGIETVLEAVNIEEILKDVDFVITGEGKIDGQSVYGKVPVGVALYAQKANLPVLAIVGDIGDGAEKVYDHGINSLMSTVNRAMPLSEAMAQGGDLLEEAAERAMRMVQIGLLLK